MDDVRVHYNSDKPAQLQALAYAQGTDIHVSPGQEKHLPHEAWHVVQQKQGRVQATMQMKGGVAVNDDKGLEQEADAMGVKSIQSVDYKSDHLNWNLHDSQIVQRATEYDGLLPKHDSYLQSYNFNGTRSADFTYHHIIPENILITALKILKIILEQDQSKPELRESKKILEENAENQWIKARVQNTVYEVNRLFPDNVLKVDASEMETCIRKHQTLDSLYNEIKEVIIEKIKVIRLGKIDKLKKAISESLNEKKLKLILT